jgi:hypothetical protein
MRNNEKKGGNIPRALQRKCKLKNLQTDKEFIIYIQRPLERVFLERLNDLRVSLKLKKDAYISHSIIYKRIGVNFSIKHYLVKEIIEYYSKIGFLKICPRGVKLNFYFENEK